MTKPIFNQKKNKAPITQYSKGTRPKQQSTDKLIGRNYQAKYSYPNCEQRHLVFLSPHNLEIKIIKDIVCPFWVPTIKLSTQPLHETGDMRKPFLLVYWFVKTSKVSEWYRKQTKTNYVLKLITGRKQTKTKYAV